MEEEHFHNIALSIILWIRSLSVADPGFPVGGGVELVGGAVDPQGGYVSKIFACQNERIWTRRGGGARAGRTLPRSANAYDHWAQFKFLGHKSHSLLETDLKLWVTF